MIIDEKMSTSGAMILEPNDSNIQTKLHHQDLSNIRSQDIRVGDILWLQDDEIIPVDCMVLQTTNQDGSCMISTGQLDGERALKPKYALRET